MVLSDKRIKEELSKNVVIEPFKQENLSTSSYDVTLGEHFYRPARGIFNKFDSGIYNIWSENATRRYWELDKAFIAGSMFGYEGSGISPEDKVILIAPGETILAHTNEFIGAQNTITTMMKARSSLGRQGIAVCKCAGWGDVGYINRWTMEISNSTEYAIPLVVGRRIAQIVFLETGPISEKDYSAGGKYQTSSSLEELMKEWKPEDMLPKLWKDRDIKK